MKHTKKNIIFFGAVAIALLMVSSVTAVPQVNSEPLNKYLEKDEIEAKMENILGTITDLDEFSIDEFVGYYSGLHDIVIDSQEGEFLSINSEVNYYTFSSEEIMIFLKDFFQSYELFDYCLSDEFDNLANDILAMVTDWNNVGQLANDLFLVVESSEFSCLVDDIKTLIEDEPFFQNVGGYNETIELVDGLSQLIGLVIAITLCPITIMFGFNPITATTLFPIILMIGLIPGFFLGIILAVPMAVYDNSDFLDEALAHLNEILDTWGGKYGGLLIYFLVILIVPILIIVAAIQFIVSYSECIVTGTIWCDCQITDYVLIYLELINEKIFGNTSSNIVKNPISQASGQHSTTSSINCINPSNN
jgi:hypothetical protein